MPNGRDATNHLTCCRQHKCGVSTRDANHPEQLGYPTRVSTRCAPLATTNSGSPSAAKMRLLAMALPGSPTP